MAGSQISGKNVAIGTTSGSGNVDLVYLSGAGFSVRVTNVNGAAPLWFTVSHPGGACPVPTVGGVNEYLTASVPGMSNSVRHAGQFGSVVQLVSSGSVQYMVELQGNHATS